MPQDRFPNYHAVQARCASMATCGHGEREGKTRYVVITWHGEHRSLFYVVDSEAPEDEGPAVLASYTERAAAEGHCAELGRRREVVPGWTVEEILQREG
jgi:hypothetical protein